MFGIPATSLLMAKVTVGGLPVAGVKVFMTSLTPTGGGHAHTEGRPAGIVVGGGCITNDLGECQAEYVPSQFGGQESVEATIPNASADSQQVTLEVGVPLVAFAGGEGIALPANADTQHPGNHYIKAEAAASLAAAGKAFFEATGVLMRVNDISLERGGGFDLKGKWDASLCPPPSCVGHGSHRRGSDVDIENVDRQDELKPIMGRYLWKFIPEGGSHYPHFRWTGGGAL